MPPKPPSRPGSTFGSSGRGSFKSGQPKRKSWSRPLADLVGKAIDPVLARQGFSEAELILNWDDIVGERLAASSRPIKLQWPPRPAGGGQAAPGQVAAGQNAAGQNAADRVSPGTATLLVRVEGAFALELQHLADTVLARVNAHLGWRCVGRLALRQGPIERMDAERAAPPRPAPAAVEAAQAQAAGIEDEALRAALVRLGGHVLTRKS